MVSTSLAHGLILSKTRHFVLYNFLSVVVFGLIYYTLQFVDGKTFVSNRAIQEQNVTKTKHYALAECLHFSLVTQSTIGYGGMIPLSHACVMVNSLQLMTIFWITASSIGK